MRGGLGIGGPSQSYAADISTSYDPKSGVYTGEIFSRGGLYRVDAWDQATLYSKIGEVLQNEYREMTREVMDHRKREFGSGIGHHEGVTHHREHGVKVVAINAHKHKKGGFLSKAMEVADISSMAMAAMSGDWGTLLTHLLGSALEEDGPEHDDEDGPKLYSAEFAGVLITAATPALLAKKLLFQKNRRIDIIMSHMRSLEENRLNGSTVENIGKGMYGRVGVGLSSRMKRKKIVAEKSWRTQALNKGETETGWKGKALNLRNSISTKREEAELLWTERV